MATLLRRTAPGFETCQLSPCGWLHCTVHFMWTAHLQITNHLEPMRREARMLLWDVDGSGREGWVDGRLCAQYASIDDFRGTIKCIPMRSNWYGCLYRLTANAELTRTAEYVYNCSAVLQRRGYT